MKDQEWDQLVFKASQSPHYMQSSAWALSKADSPWFLSRLIIDDIPLQVFSRTVPGLGKVHHTPQPSVFTTKNIELITNAIRGKYKQGLVFKTQLYEPYSDTLIQAFLENGWKKAHGTQYNHNVVLDLRGEEQTVFERMKRRARYESRVGQRNNVTVQKVSIDEKNINKMLNLLSITNKRTGAFIRKPDYLAKYWKIFGAAGQGDLWFAYHKQNLLAGAFVIKYGDRAWYKDGASTLHESKLMASRYLQWEIMRNLRHQNIKYYDLSGIPSPQEKARGFMAGIHTFKTGFSEDTVHYMPAMELPLSKSYKLWPKAEKQYLRLYSKLKKDYWY